MENRTTKTIDRRTNIGLAQSSPFCEDDVFERLDSLLELNLSKAKENTLFRTEREKFESELIKNPLNTENSFAYFGLLIGLFTPLAMITRFLIDAGGIQNEQAVFFAISFAVNAVSAVVGYFSGKIVGKIVREVETFSWLRMMLILPFVGSLWGAVSGGAGGLFVLVFGAVFGAMLGGMVGFAALPIFAIFHRLLKKGDIIERNQFLPVAFGVTFAICGFILGL